MLRQSIHPEPAARVGTLFCCDSKPHILEQLTNAAVGYWYTAVGKCTNPLLLFLSHSRRTLWLLHYVSTLKKQECKVAYKWWGGVCWGFLPPPSYTIYTFASTFVYLEKVLIRFL